MAVGSAFDAYVKSFLHEHIYGKNHPKANEYELRTLFEAQVDKHNHSEAWTAGQYIFGAYKDSGALTDLMFELDQSASEPRFEVSIKGVIDGRRAGVARTTSAVPLLGKPDVYFINHQGAHVILDWKVNGYYSNFPVSPMAGYRLCRDCHTPSRSHLQSHKDYIPYQFKGMEVDGGSYLESRNPDWAVQLSTYGWILGEEVGTEIITAIDQIVCAKKSGFTYPTLRIAHHRSRVSREFQIKSLIEYQELWTRITEKPFWFFRGMRESDSLARCEMLEIQAEQMWGNVPRTINEQWLADVSR